MGLGGNDAEDEDLQDDVQREGYGQGVRVFDMFVLLKSQPEPPGTAIWSVTPHM